MGTELGTVDVADFLEAFLQRLKGTPLRDCAPFVASSQKLFPRAVRISGWGHMFGNLMKTIANSTPEWPEILTGVRRLCEFFRNDTWRRHIARCLRRDAAVDVDKALGSFVANLAKWRYETLHVVFGALLAVRPVADGRDLAILFRRDDFQEPKLLDDVQRYCSAAWFWKFLAAFKKFALDPCEHGRRFGLSCRCCRELPAHRRNKCPHAGRRLKEASAFGEKLCGDFRRNSAVPIDECEGDRWVLNCVNRACRVGAVELELKTAYLDQVPYFVVRADDQAVAAECVRQFAEAADQTLDHAARWQRRTLLTSLEAVVAGHGVPNDLQLEIKALESCPRG